MHDNNNEAKPPAYVKVLSLDVMTLDLGPELNLSPLRAYSTISLSSPPLSSPSKFPASFPSSSISPPLPSLFPPLPPPSSSLGSSRAMAVSGRRYTFGVLLITPRTPSTYSIPVFAASFSSPPPPPHHHHFIFLLLLRLFLFFSSSPPFSPYLNSTFFLPWYLVDSSVSAVQVAGRPPNLRPYFPASLSSSFSFSTYISFFSLLPISSYVYIVVLLA